MIAIPSDDDVTRGLAELKRWGGRPALSDLAELADLTIETIYRHARPLEAENRPREMHSDTRGRLVPIMEDVGLLRATSYQEVRGAAAEIKKLAEEKRRKAGTTSSAAGAHGTPEDQMLAELGAAPVGKKKRRVL